MQHTISKTSNMYIHILRRSNCFFRQTGNVVCVSPHVATLLSGIVHLHSEHTKLWLKLKLSCTKTRQWKYQETWTGEAVRCVRNGVNASNDDICYLGIWWALAISSQLTLPTMIQIASARQKPCILQKYKKTMSV